MTSLTIGTFNIRCDRTYSGPHMWSLRRDGVRGAINAGGFDLVGVQEAYANQTEFLVEDPQWQYVGVGRDDGNRQGEFAAILYRPERLEVLQSGTFWLSETPDIVSFGWDAVCIRICTWGEFKTKGENPSTFWVFNCHLDHEGLKAREQAVELLLEKIHQLAGSENKALPPVFLMGDFNMTVEYAPLQKLGQALTNASSIISDDQIEPTFTGFAEHELIPLPIDHMFVSDSVAIQEYKVLPNLDIHGKRISDHRPVVITATIS